MNQQLPRLESNPWFHYFIARKTYTEQAMIGIALNVKHPNNSIPLSGKALFVSVGNERCNYGHIRNWHPFAKTYVCHACTTNNFVARLNDNEDVVAQLALLFDKQKDTPESNVDNPDQRGHLSDQDVSYTLNH